jgi:hypothetical protein
MGEIACERERGTAREEETFRFSKQGPFGLHHLGTTQTPLGAPAAHEGSGKDRRRHHPCGHRVGRNHGGQRRGGKAMAVRQEHV